MHVLRGPGWWLPDVHSLIPIYPLSSSHDVYQAAAGNGRHALGEGINAVS